MSNLGSNQRTVPEVMDLESGQIYDVSEIFSRDKREQHQQRMADEVARIRGGKVRYCCPLCHAEVLIRAYADKSYYFRHPNNPLAECPYRYASKLTPEQINAIKYDGARESGRHRQIKRMLQTSLEADVGVEAKSVLIEKKVEVREGDWTTWRRPDVQARFGGLQIAFEIQLSTTFLTVVAGRREFYLRGGGLLFWLFDEKFLDGPGMRFTERDVYYNNNCNLFFVTAETVLHSSESKACRLICRWEVPTAVDGSIAHQWEQKEVSLSDITFDVKRQRAFYFDYDAHLRKVKQEITQWEQQQREIRQEASKALEAQREAILYEHSLRMEVERAKAASATFSSGRRDRLQGFVRRVDAMDQLTLTAKAENDEREQLKRHVFAQYCMPRPETNTVNNFGNYFIRAGFENKPAAFQQVIWEYYWEELRRYVANPAARLPHILPADLRMLLCSIYALREGCVIGTSHLDLRALESDIFENYRWFYLPFVYAIRAFSREHEIGIAEKESPVLRHTAQYKANRGRQGYVPNRSYDKLIVFLFPEMAGR